MRTTYPWKSPHQWLESYARRTLEERSGCGLHDLFTRLHKELSHNQILTIFGHEMKEDGYFYPVQPTTTTDPEGYTYSLEDDGVLDVAVAVVCPKGHRWTEHIIAEDDHPYRHPDTGEMIKFVEMVESELEDVECPECEETP